VKPAGIVTTGYPAVRDKCRDIGVLHDDWQQGLGRLILAKRKDGKYAATVGGVTISIPRQVGKTFTIGSIIVALCLLFPGLTVLWTAHRTRTSNETFGSMKGMTSRLKVKPHMLPPRSVNGEQEIRFRNGSRILFGARERGFGRGFAEVDIEVFDEAQILGDKALDDMVPATNQAKHPAGALLFFMGTPPKPTDPGEAFTNKRAKALAGKSKDMVYVEFSADPKADPDDRKQWAKANPSFPSRTPLESMLRMRENLLDDESFLREGLGIWDEEGGSVISARQWEELLDAESRIESRHAFALDVSPNLSSAAIAVAGLRADGLSHVEITSSGGVIDHRPGVEWVVPRLQDMAGKHLNFKVNIPAGSAAESLLPALKRAGIPVNEIKSSDVPAACGLLYTAATSETTTLRHIGQSDLAKALAGAAGMNVGDGAWKWTRRKSSTDITPLYAATTALWAAHQRRPTPNVW
jgi:hypothetical protein